MQATTRQAATAILLVVGAMLVADALTPNTLISRNKPIFASMTGAATLNDGKYSAGNTNNIVFSTGSWAAINVGAGPSQVLVSWNSNTWYTYAQPTTINGGCSGAQYFSVPSGYTISTSSNSTNGSDGTWAVALTITDNQVSARADRIDFFGKSWVKLTMTGGSGPIDEIEVFDLSAGGDDSWFFMGNSITAQTFKGSAAVCTTFSSLVHAAYPQFTPAMVRGGVPCIKATQIADSLGFYLQVNPDVHYFAIEVGTNDGWGGGTGALGSFKTAVTTIITRLQAAGKVPIIGRICATNPAITGWQIDPAYNAAIDSLTARYGLVAGPDFHAYFLAHPEQLQSDGVHPNDLGSQSIQRLWAQTVGAAVYATATTNNRPVERTLTKRNASICVCGRTIVLSGFADGLAAVTTLNGSLITNVLIRHGSGSFSPAHDGVCVVRQPGLARSVLAR